MITLKVFKSAATKPTFKGHMGRIKRALKAISESERPLIWPEAAWESFHAHAELLTFQKNRAIPVVHTLMGKGAFRPIILIMRA